MKAAIVRAAHALTPTVTRYWITQAPGGSRLPAVVPGQYVTLRVGPRFKTFTVLAADEEGYELAVRSRHTGGRAAGLPSRLHVGAPLGVGAPGGRFTAESSAPFTHFVAAGMGINPVLAVLSGGRLRDWHLLYVDRGEGEFPFLGRIRELAEQQNGRVVTLDTGTHTRPDWAEVVAAIPVGATIGVCGPAAVVEAVRTAVAEAPGARNLIDDDAPEAEAEAQLQELPVRHSKPTIPAQDTGHGR